MHAKCSQGSTYAHNNADVLSEHLFINVMTSCSEQLQGQRIDLKYLQCSNSLFRQVIGSWLVTTDLYAPHNQTDILAAKQQHHTGSYGKSIWRSGPVWAKE